MSFAELAKRHDDFYAPAYELRVGDPASGFGDATYDGGRGVVSGVRVDTRVGRANRFSFSLENCFDRTAGQHGEFDPDLRSTFAEGTGVEVRVGYGDQATEPVLQGRIDSVKPTFPAGGAPSLSVEGFDLTRDLEGGTGTGHWSDTDLSSVVEELTAEPPFAGTEIDPGGVSIASLHHPETSDYQFLTKLATRFDCELFSRTGTFHFREQSAAEERSPEATLEYGRALRSFSPGSENPRTGSGGSSGSQPRVGTVKVRHNDEVDTEAIVGEASVTGGGDGTRVETVPVRSTEEAAQRAGAIAGEIARTGDDGAPAGGRGASAGRGGSRAETVGLPEVQVGRVLELTGIGGAHAGEYHVVSATHRVDDSGYTTSVSLRRLPA